MKSQRSTILQNIWWAVDHWGYHSNSRLLYYGSTKILNSGVGSMGGRVHQQQVRTGSDTIGVPNKWPGVDPTFSTKVDAIQLGMSMVRN